MAERIYHWNTPHPHWVVNRHDVFMNAGEITMSTPKAARPFGPSPKNYYFTFRNEEQHLFVLQPIRVHQCRWKFLCPCCTHRGRNYRNWVEVTGGKDERYTPWGLTEVRANKAAYRELTEPELLHRLLAI